MIELPRPPDPRDLFDFSGGAELIDAAYELANDRARRHDGRGATRATAAAALPSAANARRALRALPPAAVERPCDARCS